MSQRLGLVLDPHPQGPHTHLLNPLLEIGQIKLLELHLEYAEGSGRGKATARWAAALRSMVITRSMSWVERGSPWRLEASDPVSM